MSGYPREILGRENMILITFVDAMPMASAEHAISHLLQVIVRLVQLEFIISIFLIIRLFDKYNIDLQTQKARLQFRSQKCLRKRKRKNIFRRFPLSRFLVKTVGAK